MKRDAVIVSAVRTAIGKYGGSLASIMDHELGSIVIKEAVKRSNIDPNQIDDVYFGNILGLPGNVAKVAAIGAGLPVHIPATTVDRQCGSGIETVGIATAMIKSGMGDIYVVGGCESMTNKPYYLERGRKAYQITAPKFLESMFVPPEFDQVSMGETAENILDIYPFSRSELDEFSLKSHRNALRAIKDNEFKDEIIPVKVKVGKREFVFDIDEGPRKETSMEILSKLSPIFRAGGQVTAGNSSPMNDGASAMIVMSREKADILGIKPLVSVKGIVNIGVDYKTMGLGPINAVKKLLDKTGVALEEIGLIELNEAFAAQALVCIKELKLNEKIVNVNGGAIALGHPLAATGSILSTKIIYEMQKRNIKYGLVTMCIGGGQGAAILYEKE